MSRASSTASQPETTPSLSREALYAAVWRGPMVSVAAELGLSRNGVAKICDRLLIPYPGRGYWTKARLTAPPAPPALPPAPEGAEGLAYGAGAARARRARTRLSAQERREQILAVARRIAADEGVHAVTNKRVAREAGISEAQAHNCFSRRDDILVELARREVAAMNAVRESEVERGHDNQTRVTLSTVAYLRQVSERGALIQALLNLPAVREGLRAERDSRTAFSRERMTDRLNGRYGVDRDLAYGATTVLTAVCLRAGRLLAEGRIDLDLAERLSLALVTAGNRRVTRLAREAAKAEPTPPAA